MRTNKLTGVVIALSCWLLAPNVFAQNWHPQATINASVDFNGVHFTSDQVGYAVGTGGAIYKSLDGGISWTAQTSNTTQILYDVYFVDTNTGFAVGANGTIRKTVNAGVNWTTLTAAGTATTIFYEVQFINVTNGYIVGSGGKIIKTTDGTTWSTLTSGTIVDLQGLHFTSLSTGYAVGSGGLIRKTVNGGANWSALTVASAENFNDIYFLDANTGYVAGTNGEVWQTTNAGTNWTLKNLGLGSLELYSVYFSDALNGHVSSLGGYYWETVDGSDHWINYQMPGAGTLNDIHFSSAYTGHMVGNGGVLAKYQSQLEPEIQASNITFSEVYATSLKVNYTASPDIPSGYIAIRKTGSLSTTDPVDAITYTLGQTLGDGTVAFIGNSTSFNETGLTAGTPYYYKIYAYNGSGAAINYKPDAPLSGSKATYASGTPWTSAFSGSFTYPAEVHFYDANAGGVSGGYNLQTTSTGGQSWNNGFLSNGDSYYGIFFVSPATGYTVGYGSGPTRVIRRTVNGGATWVDQVRATSSWGLNDVWFTNSITGIAVGDDGNILRTTNGVSWSSVTSGTINTLRGVNFPTSTNGYAVGQGGVMLKTSSGGSAWMTLPGSGIITTNDLQDVFFTDANTGYVVGAAGTILKTTDGGTIWTTLSSGTTQNLYGVHFPDANTGYVVGMAGTILKTTDGGANWYPFTTGAGSGDFYGVHFPTPYIGYAVGTQGTTAIIMKYESVPESTSQPTALSFSSITATGLTISFTAPGQPTDGYIVIRKAGSAPTSDPLDGIGYTAGNTLGDGIVAYSGSATSFTETALSPGTNYFYKIYAYNSSGTGGSTNYLITAPLSGNTTTTLLPPVANNASSISTTAFTASWAAVTGAIGYQLDVSADNFSTFVSGYNNLTVGGISSSVTGVVSGTTYSYRVRSVNVSGPSLNSNVISTITVPSAPVSSAATVISTTNFVANWAAAVGATGYFLDVSANNFGSNLAGYNNLPLSSTILSITGLSAGTTYQYRVRAVNASGTSVNSGTINTITLSPAPTSNAATSIIAVSFTANWTTATGAADYRIDVSSDPSFSFIVGSYNNQTVAGTSVSVTGLNAGNNYYYRIRASNASGSSANSGPISVLTLPAAPVANDAGSIGSATFAVSWNSVSTATGYFIDVSTSNTFSSFVTGYNNTPVSSTSTTITVPVEGITYYYRVRAVNTTGASANSNVITTLLKPAAPVASAATSVTGVSFTANWASASGATGYTLEVSSDNFVSNIAGYDNLNVGGTTTSVININEGITYKYRVRAVNASWSSVVSNTISIVTVSPPPVAINPISVSTTAFTAKWNATSGAASYLLDVSPDNFSTFASGFNNVSVTGTSAAVPALTAGTTYQYRLRAVNSTGTSGNSNVISTITLPSTTTANASTSISSTGFTASWNAVSGASDYRIDVSSSNTFSSFEGIYNNLTITGTSLAISALTLPGSTYYYRLRANNASGPSVNSNVITTLLTPAAPNATAATAISTTGFTANWNAVTGATGYRLDVSVNDFISNLTGFDDLTVVGTSKAVNGLTAGTTYKFRVRAINATDASLNSIAIVTVTVPPAPVATGATVVSTTGFTANWNTTSGIPAYFLDVATDAGFVTFVSGYNNFASSSGSQTITGLTNGSTYYYRVRAANVSGTSANSNVITAVTLPLTPTANAATSITATGFTANWATVTGATEYRIDVSTDNGFSFYVGSYFNQQVTGNSLIISGLTAGTLYYYRVRSGNASGASSNSSTINVLTLPGAPVANDALSITSTTFLATWNSVSTATGYFIDVSTASSFSSFITGFNNASAASTSATVTVPTEGTTYYYRVRAISAAGTSANSNTISTLVKPAAPTANTATGVTASGFTASWSAAAGATGYYLDVSSNNFASYISPYNNFLLAGTSVAITSLDPGTNYQYRVRSYNATGSSSNSTTITLVTIPPAPVATNSTSFTTTSFTANWQAASGAANYRLDVSSAFDFASGTFVSGFNDLTVSGSSANVTGLSPGTVYYYRVRAANASGTSPNSNVTSSTNIPPPPTGLFATGIATTVFTANWVATPGALGYLLDVSLNNFGSFVSGYNNVSVSGTSLNIIGLSPGTPYQFRVRATNASGTSLNSSTLLLETLPNEPAAQPTLLTFNTITTTTMKVVFTASSGGATGYLVLRKTDSAPTGSPVDGQAYTQGDPLGDGTIVYLGAATTFDDSGLSAGKTYFYNVFAYNGTVFNTNYVNSAPLASSQITVPGVPTLSIASAISQGSFSASWTSVTGATGYLIDVSSDNFTSFVTGYNSKATGNVTSFVVSGLSGGTSYQYRLRAQNAAGTSASAATQSVLTIPDTPAGLAASVITATSFVVNWNAVAGIDNYFVDLSADNNFSILAVNNASTTNPTVTFSGLGNATAYFVRVRAGNASGVSPSSTVLTATTLSGTGGPAALVIATPNFSASIKSSSVTISVNVTGGIDPKKVILHYRKITETAFLQLEVPLKSGNTFETTVQPDMADELGIEFYFTANDATALTDESDQHYFIYRAIDVASNQAIQFSGSGFNGKASTYQMFSVPYELTDQSISNLFEPALNGFSNTRWRLMHYTNGAYAEYPDQLKKIELGQGYWFNTVQQDFQIKLSAALVDQATPKSPFQITLDKGWNQIGNPYPFNVDWKTIVDANPAAGLNAIWHFENGSFTKKDVLQVWRGAFVFSENGGVISFPLQSKTSASGREASEPMLDKSAGEWQLPMVVAGGDLHSQFSVGMRMDAKTGKDKYDEISVPRFLDYLEMSTSHHDFFAPDFSSDVVPIGQSYTWEFKLNTNLHASHGSISWDKEKLADLGSSVLLLDVKNQVLVNMKTTSHYGFDLEGGQQFRILVTSDKESRPGITELGAGYPNPFVNSLRVPVYTETENSNVSLQVFNAMGQPVKTLEANFKEPGYYELEWDGSPADPSMPAQGLLLYRVTVNGSSSTLKRIIKLDNK